MSHQAFWDALHAAQVRMSQLDLPVDGIGDLQPSTGTNLEPETERGDVDENQPACGAPKDWPQGYLPCGCRNDGHGRHVR